LFVSASASAGHADPHPFPTRRSSDLTPGIVGGAVFSFITSFDEVVVAVFLAGYSNKTLPVKIWESIRLEFTPVIAVAATMMIVRSEEHTSELQSRENLVCRLLLEKKK